MGMVMVSSIVTASEVALHCGDLGRAKEDGTQTSSPSGFLPIASPLFSE